MGTPLIIGIIVCLAAIQVVGDYFIKLSGNGKAYIAYPPFFTGMLIYALTAIGWFFVMKHIKLGVLGVFEALTTVTLLTVVGVVVFREHLNAADYIGIALALASISILARYG